MPDPGGELLLAASDGPGHLGIDVFEVDVADAGGVLSHQLQRVRAA